MAKMTLISNHHPAGHCVLAAVDGEGPFMLFEGEEVEVHPKRALCYLGCDEEFKITFTAEDLEVLSDDDLILGVQLLDLENASALRDTLVPLVRKTTVQRVKETIASVTTSTNPTTTNDESSDEADSADESE
jgi:hypothetical protein